MTHSLKTYLTPCRDCLFRACSLAGTVTAELYRLVLARPASLVLRQARRFGRGPLAAKAASLSLVAFIACGSPGVLETKPATSDRSFTVDRQMVDAMAPEMDVRLAHLTGQTVIGSSAHAGATGAEAFKLLVPGSYRDANGSTIGDMTPLVQALGMDVAPETPAPEVERLTALFETAENGQEQTPVSSEAQPLPAASTTTYFAAPDPVPAPVTGPVVYHFSVPDAAVVALSVQNPVIVSAPPAKLDAPAPVVPQVSVAEHRPTVEAPQQVPDSGHFIVAPVATNPGAEVRAAVHAAVPDQRSEAAVAAAEAARVAAATANAQAEAEKLAAEQAKKLAEAAAKAAEEIAKAQAEVEKLAAKAADDAAKAKAEAEKIAAEQAAEAAEDAAGVQTDATPEAGIPETTNVPDPTSSVPGNSAAGHANGQSVSNNGAANGHQGNS